MTGHIQLEDGVYGRRAVITSTWSNDMADYLLANKVVELELNDGKGWRGDDLSFLEKLPQLKAFKILDFTISSVEPIHFLPALASLEVITYCRSEIRFGAFPLLEECALEWRPKAASLFDHAKLKRLFVNRYSGVDFTSLARLVKLESLAVLNAPLENLFAIGSIRNLRCLRLAGLKRLASLAGIEGLEKLEELEVHTCRSIQSIEQVGCLTRLKKLSLNNDGRIESLKPLNRLNGLESVLFYESTNILDGDLSPLLRQDHLSRVSFQNRRHYSHRREEFGDSYTR
jgi:hypothetical protein